MKFWMRFLIVAWLAIGSAFGFLWNETATANQISVAELPAEARQTIALIRAGGPFPFSRDGITFGNFEKRLPIEPRGYYREYTVKTPWRNDRGPRRIISGKRGEFYYTEDHYRTFRKVSVQAVEK